MRAVNCEFATSVSACPKKQRVSNAMPNPSKKAHTCRDLLEPIHGIAIERLEHPDVPLLQPAFDKRPMRKQLVGEMTIEKNTFSTEHPEEGYTRRELVDKEDVVLECGGTKEEL